MAAAFSFGIHSDGSKVTCFPSVARRQDGRRLSIRLTSIRSPHRQGQTKTAHFGFEPEDFWPIVAIEGAKMGQKSGPVKEPAEYPQPNSAAPSSMSSEGALKFDIFVRFGISAPFLDFTAGALYGQIRVFPDGVLDRQSMDLYLMPISPEFCRANIIRSLASRISLQNLQWAIIICWASTYEMHIDVPDARLKLPGRISLLQLAN
ncbi:MAG: hypothetical protein ACJ8AH_27320 [Stellaceae bacterium]